MPGEQVRAGDGRVEDEGCDGPRDEVEHHPALLLCVSCCFSNAGQEETLAVWWWSGVERLVRTDQRNLTVAGRRQARQV